MEYWLERAWKKHSPEREEFRQFSLPFCTALLADMQGELYKMEKKTVETHQAEGWVFSMQDDNQFSI